MHGRELRVEGSPNPLHWFGAIDTAADGYPDASTWTPRGVRWNGTAPARTEDDGDDVACGLWRVTTYGAAAGRTNTGGLSLTPQQLRGEQPAPAGSTIVRRPSPVWVEIILPSSAGRSIIVDAGQTVFVYATTVSVRPWMPGPLNPANGGVNSTWLELDYGTQAVAVPVFEAMASEGLLYCQIARVDSARQQGQDFALLTTSYYVAAGEQPDEFRAVPIPTGARRVYATRDDTGAVVDTRLRTAFTDGSGGGTQLLGTIPVDDSQSVYGPQHFANATHVLLPILAEPVLWSLTWEIAP